jgi:hypothetical protein
LKETPLINIKGFEDNSSDVHQKSFGDALEIKILGRNSSDVHQRS